MKKIKFRNTNTRSAFFWTNFRKALASGGGTNADGYIGIFTRELKLKPAAYQFGERRVTL